MYVLSSLNTFHNHIYSRAPNTMTTSAPKTLDECTKANTPRWNFNGLKAVGKVVSVYDGDTVTVAFNTFGIGFFMHNMRLLGIDAPEIKSISEKEKAAAIKSRDYLRAIVQDRGVSFEVSETDKYGRLLVTMHCGSIDISAAMLSSGNAKPYSGGTREPYTPTV